MDFLLEFRAPKASRMQLILWIVRERQHGLGQEHGVLPVMVQAWLEDYRAEQTLRKDMVALWRAGLLKRIGGQGARRGYRVN